MAGDRERDQDDETTRELEEQVAAALQRLGITPTARRPYVKTDWTVDELYDAMLPERAWVVPGLLPTGLASLAGRPKLGKSFLALQLAAAVAEGKPFLERKVQEGPVLFIALEDPPQRLRERVKSLSVPRCAPIQFYTTWPPLNSAQGMEELELTVAESKPWLVVIDTLARAYDQRVEWNSVGEATAAMSVLQRLAHAHGCCVLTVDHHKKPGVVSNVVDDILGSTGKAAVLDTVWGLYKDRLPGTAVLRVTGRDLDSCDLPLRFDEGVNGWYLRPAADLRPQLSLDDNVARTLCDLGGTATTADIAQRTAIDPGNVSRALRRLVAAGLVERLPRRGHQVPYRCLPGPPHT